MWWKGAAHLKTRSSVRGDCWAQTGVDSNLQAKKWVVCMLQDECHTWDAKRGRGLSPSVNKVDNNLKVKRWVVTCHQKGATHLKIRSFVRDSCWPQTRRRQLSGGKNELLYVTRRRTIPQIQSANESCPRAQIEIDDNLRQKFSSSKRWEMVTHLKSLGIVEDTENNTTTNWSKQSAYHVLRSVYIPAGAERERGWRRAQARTRW